MEKSVNRDNLLFIYLFIYLFRSTRFTYKDKKKKDKMKNRTRYTLTSLFKKAINLIIIMLQHLFYTTLS